MPSCQGWSLAQGLDGMPHSVGREKTGCLLLAKPPFPCGLQRSRGRIELHHTAQSCFYFWVDSCQQLTLHQIYQPQQGAQALSGEETCGAWGGKGTPGLSSLGGSAQRTVPFYPTLVCGGIKTMPGWIPHNLCLLIPVYTRHPYFQAAFLYILLPLSPLHCVLSPSSPWRFPN